MNEELSAIKFLCDGYCKYYHPEETETFEKVRLIIEDARKYRDKTLHYQNQIKRIYAIREAYTTKENQSVPYLHDVDSMRSRIYELEMELEKYRGKL